MNVEPWDLVKKPSCWLHWALLCETAEAQAQKHKEDTRSKKLKKQSSQRRI